MQTHYNETRTTPKPGHFSTESLYGHEDSGCNCGEYEYKKRSSTVAAVLCAAVRSCAAHY